MSERIELESYAMLLNCDKSIEDLNPIIKPFGYSLKFYNLKELEINFSSFFGWREDFALNPIDHLDVANYGIKSGFHDALVNYFGNGIAFQEGVIMIKGRVQTYLIKENNTIKAGENWGEVVGSLQRFTETFIRHLRLFKAGPIVSGAHFEIRKVDRHVYSKMDGRNKKLLFRGLYSISTEEIDRFKENFKPDFEINELCKLAFDSFELSYTLGNPQTRFVTLMTALESLFNQGKDQITHIVSRHLALIVSTNRAEFQEHYKALKKLYGVRSTIVHGQSLNKVNLGKECNALAEYVRKALNYCLKLDVTRKELFDELNTKGF